jgi:TPR repeat protein
MVSRKSSSLGWLLLACACLVATTACGREPERTTYPTASEAREACNEGGVVGCRKLGVRCERGDGVDPDAARAVSLYTRACHENDQAACGPLARL